MSCTQVYRHSETSFVSSGHQTLRSKLLVISCTQAYGHCKTSSWGFPVLRSTDTAKQVSCPQAYRDCKISSWGFPVFRPTDTAKQVAGDFVYSRFLRTSRNHEYTCVLPPVRRLVTSQPKRRLSSSCNPMTSVFTALPLLSLFLMSQDEKLSEV